MTIKISVDLGGAKEKTSPENLRKGQLAIADQAIIDMDPFIPLRDGPLRTSAHASGDGKQIAYDTVYARAQFYGGAYNKKRSWSWSSGKTPGTGPRWDLKAAPLHGHEWAEVGLRAMGIKR